MPQLIDLPDAPAAVDDNEMIYVRLLTGASVSRKRKLSTLLDYFRNPASSSVTPTWGADTANPVLGNGALACRLNVHGKLIRASITLQIGSTTTLGTGPWFFRLPSPYTGNAVADAVGVVRARNTAGAVYKVGACVIGGGANKIYIASDGQANPWQSNVPHAWAAGDTLVMSIAYEVP